jgi:hypothetical protein
MATKPIKQSMLKRIAQSRAMVEKLERRLEADEASVLAAIKAGSPLAIGLFTAEIKVTERRTTAWKERASEFVDEVRGVGEGAKWTARIIAATKPSVSEKLVVKVAG